MMMKRMALILFDSIMLLALLGCTEIDREFFLARNWFLPQAHYTAEFRTYKTFEGLPDSLQQETLVDQIYDFGSPGLRADFREDGTYTLSSFPGPTLSLILADTLGNWELDGDTLRLIGSISGQVSDFRLVKFDNHSASMIKEGHDEVRLPDMQFLHRTHQKMMLMMQATPK